MTTVQDWIEDIFQRRQDLEGEALASLTRRGILRHEKSKLLWVIEVERFLMISDHQQQYVKQRLQQAVLSDDIPDTRDIMLVSIAAPCGLLGYVLPEERIEARRERIRVLSNLETISRKVNAAIVSLDLAMRQAMTKVV